ncbi:MAG: ASPIC/UnbV domain-containing protein, partial [Methanococcaceae archaeon]
SAIGAVVKIKAQLSNNPVWQMRKVAGQNGYCGQTLQLHYGLKDASVIDSLQIKWPSGIIQSLTNVTVNQELTIEEDTSLTTSVEQSMTEPGEFFLYQNYPNPFNPTTIIRYSLKNPEFTSLKVYDVLGKQVSELINKEQSAGEYQVEFDAKNLASGTYFYILRSGGYIQTRKMSIVK